MYKKRDILLIMIVIVFFAQAQIETTLRAEDLPLNYQDKLISINVKNVNIEDVLKMLAEQSNLNIIAGKNVKDTLTITLQNIPVMEALKAILEVSNYTYKKEGDIIKVYTWDDLRILQESKKLQTKVFNPKYIKVTDIEPLLQTIKSNRGKIQSNPKLNQLLVYDLEEKIKKMEDVVASIDKDRLIKRHFILDYAEPEEIKEKLAKLISTQEAEIYIDNRTHSLVIKAAPMCLDELENLIKRWDVPSKQVQIEAKIMQVSLDKNFQLGIDWEYVSTNGKHRPTDYDLSSKLGLSLSEGGIFRVGALSADDYQATLEMLQTTTNSNLLSEPKITVMDGHEANIMVGSTEPYIVRYIDEDTNTTTEETKFKDVGIQLTVKPRITEGGYIRLEIEPEVSSARRVAEVNNALAIDTSKVKTILMVKDGKTVVLGGLIKDERVETTKKIPILGDIPILGLLFQNKNKANLKTELIIFITPHILTKEGDLPINYKTDLQLKNNSNTLSSFKDLKFEQEL